MGRDLGLWSGSSLKWGPGDEGRCLQPVPYRGLGNVVCRDSPQPLFQGECSEYFSEKAINQQTKKVLDGPQRTRKIMT